ncbi:nuclear speckle splicing regulatory protein 1-like [Ornithodoros turicata]|uniref:nuclear speckle splicing regulatory protein 1-like n=1 Tax=Ornithodoros turicata TaxID=34597 RepID=UPI0031395E5B
MAAPKKYGLFLPKKADKPGVAPRPSIFGDDSDDEHDKASIEASIKKESFRNLTKIQTQLQFQKAMEEDPTVFEYDEVYDDLKQVKEEKKTKVTKDRTPRYIANLMKAADNRKKENERRAQHKIQKEREQEGEAFADKEAYVTSAYRKKMQEMQEEEEKEMRREQLDEMMNVTKQSDLSGFYRHLLKQTVGEERIPENTDEPTVKREEEVEEDSRDIREKKAERVDKGQPGTSKQVEDSSETEFRKKPGKKQQYRRRHISEASDSAQNAQSEAEKNVDADSDFEIDSSDSEGEERQPVAKNGRKRKHSSSDSGGEEEESSSEKVTKEDGCEKDEHAAKALRQTDDEWVKMFEKRTVGEVFEAARERYFQRRQARRSGGQQ